MCVFRLTYMSECFRTNRAVDALFAFCKQLLHGAQLGVCIGWNERLVVKHIIFLDANIVASLKWLLSIICFLLNWSFPQTDSQMNTPSPDSSINHAHFMWSVFTIAVSLYETHLMHLIEETGFLSGIFLLWVILQCIEKHSGAYSSHMLRLSAGNVSCRNCFSESLIIWICEYTNNYRKRHSVSGTEFFSLYEIPMNAEFKFLAGGKNTINTLS